MKTTAAVLIATLMVGLGSIPATVAACGSDFVLGDEVGAAHPASIGVAFALHDAVGAGRLPAAEGEYGRADARACGRCRTRAGTAACICRAEAAARGAAAGGVAALDAVWRRGQPARRPRCASRRGPSRWRRGRGDGGTRPARAAGRPHRLGAGRGCRMGRCRRRAGRQNPRGDGAGGSICHGGRIVASEPCSEQPALAAPEAQLSRGERCNRPSRERSPCNVRSESSTTCPWRSCS